ncbi:MAG: hypothetical protein LBC77_02695 [Spirochaetaceae bacterium]|jgi:hypothetical protein|nr:hypothetical protein [Spirochaetaceae bacterium]
MVLEQAAGFVKRAARRRPIKKPETRNFPAQNIENIRETADIRLIT